MGVLRIRLLLCWAFTHAATNCALTAEAVFELPEITAAVTVLEMLATHCEPILVAADRETGVVPDQPAGNVQSQQHNRGSTPRTAALVRVQQHLAIFLRFGSPVEVRKRLALLFLPALVVVG